jgi:hypothetical protein
MHETLNGYNYICKRHVSTHCCQQLALANDGFSPNHAAAKSPSGNIWKRKGGKNCNVFFAMSEEEGGSWIAGGASKIFWKIPMAKRRKIHYVFAKCGDHVKKASQHGEVGPHETLPRGTNRLPVELVLPRPHSPDPVRTEH